MTNVNEGKQRRGRPPSSNKSRKKDLDGARSRDSEVTAAAVQLFYTKGYASTSMQEIADELGLLKGSLYYYIDSKETLLRRIFETSHEQVQEIAERFTTPDAPAIDRFKGFLDEYAMWYLNNIPRASLFAREWRHASEQLRAVMVEQRRFYDHTLRRLIVEVGEDLGLESSVDVPMMSNFIMSAVSSLPDWFHGDGSLTPAEVAARYVDYAARVVLNGRQLP